MGTTKCGLVLLIALSTSTFGHDYFQDIHDYKTLICDFHTHTVFSDGLVWPTVRVDEASREGIDVLVISDHIEHTPWENDVKVDHNRGYEVASEYAKQKNVLLVQGAEITRDTPPGHYNAIFISDANPLDTPDFFDVVEAANNQKGFVFWNHHEWKGEGLGLWSDLQTEMHERKWLHGMEVANGDMFYPRGFQWCLDKQLTMFGNSDIHEPSLDYNYTAEKHRTLTLVFAKERTVESVREALFAGRTAVWLKNRIMGRKEFIEPLFKKCVMLSRPHYMKHKTLYFEIENNALIDVELTNTGDVGPTKIVIAAHSSIICEVEIPDGAKELTLSYTVDNFLIAPDTCLDVSHEILFSKHGKGDIAYLDHIESYSWDKTVLGFSMIPAIELGPTWKFMWDPENEGLSKNWQMEGFDDSEWFDIGVDSHWEQQEVGQKWKRAKGKDYDGHGWYRIDFTLPEDGNGEIYRLFFGAIDESAKIWLNDRLVMGRVYDRSVNRNSWEEPFEVDISEFIHRDSSNTLSVCVEDNLGGGGIWKRVWLGTVSSDRAKAISSMPNSFFIFTEQQ